MERILPAYSMVLQHEMEEAIGQALGAASVSWENMEGTGVFQEDRCTQLLSELMGIATQYASAYRVTHSDATMQKVWRALKEIGWSDQEAIDSVMIMQNHGILFREAG